MRLMPVLYRSNTKDLILSKKKKARLTCTLCDKSVSMHVVDVFLPITPNKSC